MKRASQSTLARAGEPPNVFMIAGEESGDRLGGALMRALMDRTGDKVRFAGVGGDEMAAHGLKSLFPIDDITVIGFSGIPLRLATILRRIRVAANAAIAARPDVLVIIDSPDFTHRVARRVRAAVPEIPIVDYVSPTVWAWRPGRARAMRAYVDHILALLPFEPAAHERLGGPRCTYVGHPLVERATTLRPDDQEARRRASSPPLVLVLPGSRNTEINRLLEIFGTAVAQMAASCGPIEVVLPTVPHLLERVRKETANWTLKPRIVVEAGQKAEAFRTARAALAASGTVTLELAVAGVPTVVAYRASLLEEAIVRPMIRVSTIVLANLVLGENVMPEYLQRQASPDRLAAAVGSLIADTPQRRKQLDAFARLDAIMGIGATAPSEKAAAVVMQYALRGLSDQPVATTVD